MPLTGASSPTAPAAGGAHLLPEGILPGNIMRLGAQVRSVIQADPGSVSVGASLGAGVAGPLSVSVVRTTTGASTRLGRPGAYLGTELALSSPRGTLSGSATVRVDLAPRSPSLGDGVKVIGPTIITVLIFVYAGAKCLVSQGTVCSLPNLGALEPAS